jgi:hypothetical protein
MLARQVLYHISHSTSKRINSNDLPNANLILFPINTLRAKFELTLKGLVTHKLKVFTFSNNFIS